MDLTLCWRSLVEWFDPPKRALSQTSESSSAPVLILSEAGRSSVVYSDGETVTETIGETVEQSRARFAGRNMVVVSRASFASAVTRSLSERDFLAQVQVLQSAVARELPKNASELKLTRLLKPLTGWWARFLPNHHGVLIRLKRSDTEAPSHFLVVIEGARIAQYYEPDFSTGRSAEATSFEDLVRTTSERLMLPIQGVEVDAALWSDWMDTDNPWTQMPAAFRSRSARLVPFRVGPALLILTRSFTGL